MVSGTFNKAGADIQRYVAEIEYADLPYSGGQVAPNATYVSTDWTNTTQMPALKLAFEK